MRQLITRVEDRLHAKAKDRARKKGVSLNAFMVAALEEAVGRPEDPTARLRAKAAKLGMLAATNKPALGPQARASVIRATRGAGSAVSKAIESDRSHR